MLISCNWLGRHVDLDGIDLHTLGHRFTMAVAELEGVLPVGHGLETVVVGHVLEVTAIEGRRVQKTRVDTGAHGIRQIVCGAPNIAAGQRVPVALPGTVLGDLTIADAEVAGVASSGMIASERELGISDEHDGIMALAGEPAPGTPLTAVLPLADTLFEIDNKSLTHRPDLWGHRGIAREVAALIDRPLKPMVLDADFGDARPLTLSVDDAAACPRYSATTLDGVTVGPSPLWLRLLLHRVGTRPINNVVDATNFVMLDLGNPLHAFDARELAGDQIRVRRARPDETFMTLDGQARQLTSADLLIADAERGVALAGVMGGQNSEIRSDTRSIVLEAANFDAATVRMTAQRLGLRTESSARFEKSLDPQLVETAARAFCGLLIELCPDTRITSAFMDVAAPSPAPTVIDVTVAHIEERLGTSLGAAAIVKTLRDLDFGVTESAQGQLAVEVPTYRATKDIGIAADLVEEVGRIHGYDNIDPEAPTIRLGRPHANARKRFEHAARDHLSLGCGLDELQTYSFDFDPLFVRLGLPLGERLTLRNPISADMPALRRSLIPGLLAAAERNARGVDDLRLYELGRVYHPGDVDGVPPQPVHLAALVGALADSDRPDASRFFETKGIVESLATALSRTPLDVTQGGVEAAWAHPTRQARLSLNGHRVGSIAELHPRTSQLLELRQHVALFELDLDAWRTSAVVPLRYEPLPRFPPVFRDFAVLVAADVPAGDVRDAIQSASPELIGSVTFQSAYRGAGVDAGQKCVAFSVTMRHPDRTLAEPEVRDVEHAIWARLAKQVSGQPRA